MPTPAENLRPLAEQRDRFMRHTHKAGDCIEWTGSKNVWGYGYAIVAQTRVPSHRRAYELFVGPIPEGALILHSCDNPPCVNPAHLRPGSAADNGADMADRRRAFCAGKTHCAKGHEFTPENTYKTMQRGRERRHCKTCRRDARRRFEGFTGQRLRIR